MIGDYTMSDNERSADDMHNRERVQENKYSCMTKQGGKL